MKTILITLAFTLLVFFLFAFVKTEVNPFVWSEITRYTLAVFVGVSWTYVFVFWLINDSFKSK